MKRNRALGIAYEVEDRVYGRGKYDPMRRRRPAKRTRRMTWQEREALNAILLVAAAIVLIVCSLYV